MIYKRINVYKFFYLFFIFCYSNSELVLGTTLVNLRYDLSEVEILITTQIVLFYTLTNIGFKHFLCTNRLN